MTAGQKKKSNRLILLLGPGMLVAATGVGAGDLATAAFTGSRLGVTILWAVLLGAFMKYILNEGLTRWQLVTGETLLEGVLSRSGPVIISFFTLYFISWSFMVAAALMSACGVALNAIIPLPVPASTAKIIYGAGHSLLGLILVFWGGYRLFERIMSFCIGVMFFCVLWNAFLLLQETSITVANFFYPDIPAVPGGIGWTIALMGGVGGTVTILNYGYWIRESGRTSSKDLSICRFDLGVAYFMTALFGLSMVIIGSCVVVEGKGATLIMNLSQALSQKTGSVGKWTFLFGAWSAIFSSLLGVWQGVPYLFADICRWITRSSRHSPISTNNPFYRWYLFGLSSVPIIGLWIGFARMQKLYAIIGALFMPLLAMALLVINNHQKLIGRQHRNGLVTNTALIIILLFFLYTGLLTVIK